MGLTTPAGKKIQQSNQRKFQRKGVESSKAIFFSQKEKDIVSGVVVSGTNDIAPFIVVVQVSQQCSSVRVLKSNFQIRISELLNL